MVLLLFAVGLMVAKRQKCQKIGTALLLHKSKILSFGFSDNNEIEENFRISEIMFRYHGRLLFSKIEI